MSVVLDFQNFKCVVGYKKEMKTNSQTRVIFHAVAWTNVLIFWQVGYNIADVITLAKFYINWFWGFEVPTPPNVTIAIWLAMVAVTTV